MINFTHNSYLTLLADIKASGKKICSFRDLKATDEAYVILRHDIDFSLEKALDMAHLDTTAGVTSTFFFLLTAPYYNPLSEEGVAYIKKIAALGHECGLHYDCTSFEYLSEAQRQHRVETLANALQDVSGIPIKIIAQHKPAKSPIRQEFPAYVNAYSPQYISDIVYVSDSRRMFRHADITEFLKQTPKSQLLIHPIWWNENPMTREEIMQSQLSKTNEYIHHLLDDEITSINNYIEKMKPGS